MGGAKTVDASKYFSKRDPSRDVAIATAMMQAQMQQQAAQADLLKQYAGLTPEEQRYDAAQQSRRAAELGMQNILRQRELERITQPEAAAMRLAQSKEMEELTAKENVDQYMREYMRTQGLPSQYETGLGDSTIGRAALFDRALAARQAYEENLDAQRRAYLAATQAPVGGLSPETSIAGKQAAEAQNIAAQEAYRQGMLGAVGQFGQMGAQSAMQQFANLGRMQQSQQQSQQAYQQAMLENQAQNLASQRAMQGAYISAAGNIASSAIGAGSQAGAFGGGGGGLNKSGFYGGELEAAKAFNVSPSSLSYQKPSGLGGFLGMGQQGGFYYNPSGAYGR